MSVYKRVNRGVRYSRWDANDETPEEPVYEEQNGKIEEMYFDSRTGNIHINVIADDEHIFLDIPVLPNGQWNGFVDSLPKWD